MFTFLVIVGTIFFIYLGIKGDNTPDKRSEDADSQIENLPPISFYSPFSSDKAKRLATGELLYGSRNVLESFKYQNGILTLKMRNGGNISGALKNAEVRFVDNRGEITITVNMSGNKVTIIKFGNFKDREWETMINVLMLAGKTYGASIFGSAYKNLKRATLVAKIIKAIS